MTEKEKELKKLIQCMARGAHLTRQDIQRMLVLGGGTVDMYHLLNEVINESLD